ncbi:cysteine proteinase [Fomitiporia mediterranea MF3/22]|uniref:cysteine proteinase n=1 Tax=Fomitiporia mediterranea (strain MF3/22) TaxID=694068 RepID=UPI0004408EB5|nr:cysteine proteinase [Fomitiporia mediterranea MF3/22]EJD05027.1 cysteine proteinase [Fomitiporia mediterranea MF3/22]
MAKKHPRHTAPSLRQTRKSTRQNRGAALVSDPIQNTQLLNDQLRALGLYPAPTLGDGNCLFRALADQYYGSPSQHLKLRQEICDWMEAHKSRYAPFVDDERGLDVHLRCMRQPGTYGGHLELTAFAHLKRRDVKVIQPGLVYVIEWTSGADLSPTIATSPLSEQPPSPPAALSERDARRARREKKRERMARAKHAARIVQDDVDSDEENDSSSLGPVYVAYHDWEHFSSVRNLTGPHTGIPYAVEKPVTTAQASLANRPEITALSPQSSSSSIESSPVEDDEDEDDEDEVAEELGESQDPPETIPLPVSRSPSPSPSSEASTSGSALSVPPVPGYNCPPESMQNFASILRSNRSPKRAYDGVDEAAEDSQGEAKRSRRNSPHRPARNLGLKSKMDTEIDPDADTPELLSSGESSSGSSSPAATPPPSMVVVPPSPVTPTKPLTKRERKRLGLPKARSARGSSASAANRAKASAGKIIVPGGKFRKSTSGTSTPKPDSTASEEWEKNGSGRVDVRGFKELKI